MNIYSLTSIMPKTIIIILLIILYSKIGFTQDSAKNYAPDGYKIITVLTPENIPFEVAALDIHSQGTLAIATRQGEVWKLSSAKVNTERGNWHKFADGFSEPSGIHIEEDGSLIISHQTELTKITDTNQDGIADEFINLANAWTFHGNYHEHHVGAVKDSFGNMFGLLSLGKDTANAFRLGGPSDSLGGYRGWAYQLSQQGKLRFIASGLRSPGGIGISPQGDVFFTDTQGDWVPSSTLHILGENKFYGHPVSLRDHPDYSKATLKKMQPKELALFSNPPVLWIPDEFVAHSPSNPVWDSTDGKFGPFSGQIFIGDTTHSSVFRAMIEKVNGHYQGAVINFINGLQSGNKRLKFDKFGQLWVGQSTRGEHARGSMPFGIQKIVWDNGTQPFELKNININKSGFVLTFTEPLYNKTSAVVSLAAKQWHYHYGSQSKYARMDTENIDIQSVELFEGNTRLQINMTHTQGKVVAINFSGLISESGKKPNSTEVFYTINQVPTQ